MINSCHVTDCVDRLYLKLRLFDLTESLVLNITGLRNLGLHL